MSECEACGSKINVIVAGEPEAAHGYAYIFRRKALEFDRPKEPID